jgi:hypothetical protein
MGRARGRAGTHTTLIEAAVPLVRRLDRLGRVSRGLIEAGIGARGHAVKVTPLAGGLRITVVSKGSRQELHAYGISLESVAKVLADPEFRAYKVNLPS